MEKPLINVGGQAIIKGVMMRSPNSFAIAVRRSSGEIAIKEDVWTGLTKKLPLLRKPFLRGAVVLVESMHNGMKALSWSAEQAMEDEERAEAEERGDDPDLVVAESKADPKSKVALWGTLILSLALGFAVFIGIPHALSYGAGALFDIDGLDGKSPLFHLVAGTIKIGLFLGYLTLISRMPDIAEVFEYHGAEHKSIFCYEKGEELTLDNAWRYPTLHPRCGTSFLFIVIFTSIVLFSAAFVAMPDLVDNEKLNQLLYILIKLPLMLPIAGLAYEFQRLSSKYPNSKVVAPLIWPGLMLQKITTKEPSDEQLEVALASLRKVLWREAAGKATASEDDMRCSEGVEFYKDYMAIKPTPNQA